MTPEPAAEVACRACHCTRADPCPGGCFWVERTLCSQCAMMREAMVGYLTGCREVTGASMTLLMDEAADILREYAVEVADAPLIEVARG
jgi:hypothetical protein